MNASNQASPCGVEYPNRAENTRSHELIPNEFFPQRLLQSGNISTSRNFVLSKLSESLNIFRTALEFELRQTVERPADVV